MRARAFWWEILASWAQGCARRARANGPEIR
jgi:hypothetical protein